MLTRRKCALVGEISAEAERKKHLLEEQKEQLRSLIAKSRQVQEEYADTMSDNCNASEAVMRVVRVMDAVKAATRSKRNPSPGREDRSCVGFG